MSLEKVEKDLIVALLEEKAGALSAEIEEAASQLEALKSADRSIEIIQAQGELGGKLAKLESEQQIYGMIADKVNNL